MTTALAKYISKRFLAESAKNRFGKDDPYFEEVPATGLDGRVLRKTKKKRRAVPAGISEHDAKVLNKVKRRAYFLDVGLFNFCGIKFGWGSAIGLIPELGDVLDGFMAAMVIATCCKIDGGLPREIKSKMVFNLIVDLVIGLVPFLGDIADALFRCNTKNAVILERYLADKGQRNLEAQRTRGQIRRTTEVELLTDNGEVDEGELRPPPAYGSADDAPPTMTPARSGQATIEPAPTHAAPAGWFGSWGRGRQAAPDAERADGPATRKGRSRR